MEWFYYFAFAFAYAAWMHQAAKTKWQLVPAWAKAVKKTA